MGDLKNIKRIRPFSALARIRTKTDNHWLGKSPFVLALVALLVASYLFSVASTAGKDKEIATLNSEVNQLKDCLECNISQVENLSAQVTDLKKGIVELKDEVSEKTAENEELKQQVHDLNHAFSDIEAELEGLVESEEIYLFVDRLRYPYPPTE